MLNEKPSYLRRLRKRIQAILSLAIGGGRWRESILLRLLLLHYRCRQRREWKYALEPPHFSNHRVAMARFAFGEERLGPEFFYRGFFSSELLRPADRVLDIGCGDGFFAKRFFAPRCQSVDAIDVEPSAIRAARTRHPADNVRHYLLDAVAQPFPAAEYDVIIWDGALGHFSTEVTDHMLSKIRGALSPDGAFSGSESLGLEGQDHLQFFHGLADLRRLFERHFTLVQLRAVRYPLPDGFVRTEAFWRCAQRPERLATATWTDLDPAVARAA